MSPILSNPLAFETLVSNLSHHLTAYTIHKSPKKKIDAVVGLDSRGFIFGPILALRLGAAFVMVRKKGKPWPHHKSYNLGSNSNLRGWSACFDVGMRYGNALELKRIWSTQLNVAPPRRDRVRETTARAAFSSSGGWAREARSPTATEAP